MDLVLLLLELLLFGCLLNLELLLGSAIREQFGSLRFVGSSLLGGCETCLFSVESFLCIAGGLGRAVSFVLSLPSTSQVSVLIRKIQ